METIAQEQYYLKELLKFYRIQRHDFLNDFQVAMGYIQLGKGDKALDYLKKAAEQATVQGAISRATTPELSVELMRLNAVCFDLGLELRVILPEDLPVINWSSTYTSALDILRTEVCASSGVELRAKPGERGIVILVSFLGLARASLDNLAAKLLALDIQAGVETDQSGVMLVINLV